MKRLSMSSLGSLLLAALLVACPAAPEPTPAAPARPTPSAPVVAKPLTPTVRPLGKIELTVDTRNAGAGTLALTPSADSGVTFPTAGRVTEVIDSGSNRFIMARFPVTANQNFGNLTLVAYQATGNEASSAFKNFQSFGGTPSASNVYSIRPTHGVDASAGPVVVSANKADLQVLTSAESASLTAAARAGGTPVISASEYALEYAYVARRCTANCASATPTWTRGFSAGQAGQVTVAVRVPQTGDPGSGYRFSITLIVSDDASTQFSQSLEELSAGTVAGLPAVNAGVAAATSVRVLCNSAYAGANKAFVLGARTAGNGVAPLAQYGAQFYRNSTAASYAGIANTTTTVSAVTGLATLYTALPGTALSFAGGSSGNGGQATVTAAGGFELRTPAGSVANDTLGFSVSDDQGCSAAPQTVPVTISGPLIWFVNAAYAGSSDGRQATPFKTLSDASTASAAGQTIFVYSGNYTGLALKANQRLLGQPEGVAALGGAVVAPGTVGATLIEAAAGTAPVLQPASGDSLTLVNGASIVRGVKLGGNAAGTALKGSNFGSLSIANTTIDTPGAAIDLSTGALDATLQSVSSGSGAGAAPVNGIKLNALSGTGLTVTGVAAGAGSGGTIQRSSAAGILVTNSSALRLNYISVRNTIGEGIRVSNSGVNATALSVQNSALQNIGSNAAQKYALNLQLLGSGNSTFDLVGNVISSAATDMGGVNVQVCGAGLCNAGTLVQGRINNNTISLPGAAATTQSAIEANIESNGKLRVEVIGNTVSGYGLFGIKLTALLGNANLQATVRTNAISAPGSLALDAIDVYSGTSAVFAANTVCLNISSNTITDPSNLIYGIWLEQRKASSGNSVFALQGVAGAAPFIASVVSSALAGLNTVASLPPSQRVAADGLGDPSLAGSYSSATCETVSF